MRGDRAGLGTSPTTDTEQEVCLTSHAVCDAPALPSVASRTVRLRRLLTQASLNLREIPLITELLRLIGVFPSCTRLCLYYSGNRAQGVT